MITLDEYKEYLINFYRSEIDSGENKKMERKDYLSSHYSDQYLQKIIDDTYSFINDILSMDTIKDGYCVVGANENSLTTTINLSITGGGPSDDIYIDLNGRYISSRLLNKVFGNSFVVFLKVDEIEYDVDEDILGVTYNYYIQMQNFPINLDEIKEELFGKSKKR